MIVAAIFFQIGENGQILDEIIKTHFSNKNNNKYSVKNLCKIQYWDYIVGSIIFSLSFSLGD